MDLDVQELREALEESVKLQSFYALCLNERDGGCRLRFATIEDWIERLRACKHGDGALDVARREAAECQVCHGLGANSWGTPCVWCGGAGFAASNDVGTSP